MLYYLVIIGIVNLGLGYALAVRFGYGPPSLSAAWRVIDSLPGSLLVPRVAVTIADVTPAIVEEVLPVPEMPLPVAVAVPEPAPVEEPISHLAMLDDSEPEEVFTQPDFEAYDDDAVEVFRRDRPDNWETNSKYVETSMQNLNVAMMKSGARAIELDNRLRACRGHTDAATVEEGLAQLKEDCQTYLDELGESGERFQGRVGECEELRKLAMSSEMTDLDQAAQIETTLSNLEHMDFTSDLETANTRLIEELDHLRVARHAWRDSQEATFLAFARIEKSVDKIEKQLRIDATTGLPNRIGLEMVLDDWWKEGRHQNQSLAALLIDIDGLGKLNRLQGALVGDTLLYQVARYLRATVSEADIVIRAGGGRFLIVLPEGGPGAACKMAEFLRLSIEQIQFKRGEETLQITISVGATVVRPEELNREPMFARLSEAVKHAKRAGRNCSYLHDGEGPRQVEIPPPTVESREITL